NFSFGDYFKAEAIQYGWELVTEVWGLSPDVLSATVFEEDDEAAGLWARVSGLPPERIRRCGAGDNFWAMGETGPCGPCSEIFVDRHPGRSAVAWEEGTESGRYLEIWNLVFMQFDRDAAGTLRPLPNPSIDTGAGLERVAAVLGGVDSNYDTDLFQPILAAAATLARTAYGRDGDADVSLRVIADHLRAVTFLLADGVVPASEGRGYVLRRILRRALRHGMRLGFEEPFLHRLVPVLGEVMGEAYPELAETRQAAVATVRAEEEKFLSTLATGAEKVQEAIAEQSRVQGAHIPSTAQLFPPAVRQLPGRTVFHLYDTYGLPLEVIREIAEEERFTIDEAGFEAALDEQRERSREATGESQRRLAAVQRLAQEAGAAEPTRFVGYDALELAGVRPRRVIVVDDQGPRLADRLRPGETGEVFFDQTVFYAEGGGQVGDVGELQWPGGSARVVDTQKDRVGNYYHTLEVAAGELTRDTEVALRVDLERRRDTERNHTATHLLHAALRRVLGEGVRQAGSLVHPDRLRFDFTFPRPLSGDERLQVEDLVNRHVRRAEPVAIAEEAYRQALGRGATALFGEKYGESVRTVEVPGFSLELCGGCHVRNTGEIGLFLMTAERGVASGVRRIEAVTGRGALDTVRERERLAARLEAALGVPVERAAEELAARDGRLRE
ncbi:MAG TPA: alanine--tRNA ligase, partial [Thermoanaerobaculia bacterium]|nr:alanine--tRNA ligase [Thermoanaerobaculia bacterium]